MKIHDLFGGRSRMWHLLLLGLTLLFAPLLPFVQPILAQAAPGWTIHTVDSDGLVGQDNALALDSSGRPVISYLDRTNFDLKLVHCGDLTCSSGNSIVVDSSGMVGAATALVLDSVERPVISYYDIDNAALKLAYCGDPMCSSGNSLVTVDSGPGVGSFTALALGIGGKPIIAYRDDTNGDLKVVQCGDVTCSSGNSIVTVDSTGDVGYQPSLRLNATGSPIISYYDNTNRALKLVHCGNADCTANNSIVTVDSDGEAGGFNSLAFDGNGYPLISYSNNGHLLVAHCSDVTCAGPKTIVAVDQNEQVGWGNSLQRHPLGLSLISYYDSTNQDIKLVLCGDIGCTSGGSTAVVDSVGSGIGTFIPPTTSLFLDDGGRPVISYWDPFTDDLKLARLVGADATPPTISYSLSGAAGNNGWSISDVTVAWQVADNESTIGAQTGCQSTTITNDTHGVTLTCFAISAGGSSSQGVTLKRDATAPLVVLTGVSNGASYPVGSVPVAGCTTTDGLSGVATQATVSVTGGTGSFTATCSGATDNAGNSAAPVSVNYTVDTPPTATPTNTPITTPEPPTASPTNTPVSPTATPTNTPLPPIATPTPQATLPASSYGTVQQVRNSLVALLPSGDRKIDQALQKAIAKLDQGFSPDFWQLPAGNQLSSQGQKAFEHLRDAIKELRKLKAPPAAVTAAIDTVTGVGRTLAEQAIAAATAAGGNAKQLAKANKEMVKAQQDLAKQRPNLAFAHYEDAWVAAQTAVGAVLAAAEPEDAAVAADPADADHVHDDLAGDRNADETTIVQQLFLPLIAR